MPLTAPVRRKRILAVASGGGHWEELLLLRPAFEDQDVLFATTLAGLAERAGLTRHAMLPDCNADQKLAALRCTLAAAWLLLRFRPQVIISTGALPGFIVMAIGKAFGARTIWIDSIANAEEFSAAGAHARRVADLRLSQWPDVADAGHAEYAGNLL